MGILSGLVKAVTAPLTAPAKIASAVSGAVAKVAPNQITNTIAATAKAVSLSQNRVADTPARNLSKTLAQPGGRKRAIKNTLSGGVGWAGDALANERGIVGWGGRKAQKISSNGNKAAPYVAGAVLTVYGGPVAAVAKNVTAGQATRKINQELAQPKPTRGIPPGYRGTAPVPAQSNPGTGVVLVTAAIAAKLFLFS